MDRDNLENYEFKGFQETEEAPAKKKRSYTEEISQ